VNFRKRKFLWRRDECRKCGHVRVIGIPAGASVHFKRRCSECKGHSLKSTIDYRGPEGTITVGEERVEP